VFPTSALMQNATSLETKGGTASLAAAWRSLTFDHLALATVLMTYGLIVLGGVVRVTDSGTACPDWPLCHGQLLPRMEQHVLIEYSHRLAASIVGLFIVGMALVAWRRCRGDRIVTVTAILAIVLLAAQVLAGAATVNTETDADVVALHLSIALTLFGTLIVLALAATRTR
jgi:cytochrome c oxidase assembly protein subunit 15